MDHRWTRVAGGQPSMLPVSTATLPILFLFLFCSTPEAQLGSRFPPSIKMLGVGETDEIIRV